MISTVQERTDLSANINTAIVFVNISLGSNTEKVNFEGFRPPKSVLCLSCCQQLIGRWGKKPKYDERESNILIKELFPLRWGIVQQALVNLESPQNESI